jgi:hypothetical protein
VSVNYHTLSDFRVDHGAALDDLLTQLLALLMKHGFVKVERVAQDGTKVRASAGAASFHREATLNEHLELAREQVEQVKREGRRPNGQGNRREQAARERVAREHEERVRRALEELPKVREVKRTEQEKAEARVSTTDPEARVMKMGDGGFRPAYNVQLATDTESRVVVGVAVTNKGADGGQLEPMREAVTERTEVTPAEYLVDGGFVNLEQFEKAANDGTTVYAPVPEPKQEGVDRYAPKPDDTPAVAEWRARMGTEEAKEIYKERAATIETVNGDLRVHRALGQMPVRGTKKVLCVALIATLTYNMIRAAALGILA